MFCTLLNYAKIVSEVCDNLNPSSYARTLLAAKIIAESLKIAVCFFGLPLLCSCHFWEITDKIS